MANRKSCPLARPLGRRRVLECACAAALTWPVIGRGQPFIAPEIQDPPRIDDWLVFAFGERVNEPIAPGDLVPGAPQVFAYPLDPVAGALRNASRLNQIVLVRLDPAMLTDATRARAVDGIVAYSGVCTHTGCDVTDWQADALRFKCPCHESEFDPSDGARVVGGPAPLQLAALPLKLRDGRLAVAGAFEGRIGFMQPGADPFGF